MTTQEFKTVGFTALFNYLNWEDIRFTVNHLDFPNPFALTFCYHNFLCSDQWTVTILFRITWLWYFLVANCGGELMATPVTQRVSTPPLFPDYGIRCNWNISAANRLSRLSIILNANIPSSAQGRNCDQMQVNILPGNDSVLLFIMICVIIKCSRLFRVNIFNKCN